MFHTAFWTQEDDQGLCY